MLAGPPLATFCAKGLSDLVASTAALLASAWSKNQFSGGFNSAADHHLSQRTGGKPTSWVFRAPHRGPSIFVTRRGG